MDLPLRHSVKKKWLHWKIYETMSDGKMGNRVGAESRTGSESQNGFWDPQSHCPNADYAELTEITISFGINKKWIFLNKKKMQRKTRRKKMQWNGLWLQRADVTHACSAPDKLVNCAILDIYRQRFLALYFYDIKAKRR